MADQKKADKADAPITHTLSITIGGLGLLKEVMPLTQWYKNSGDDDVGMVAVDIIERMSEVKTSFPDEADEKSLKAEPYDLVLDEDEREACKKCVKFFYDQGAFLLTKDLRQLMRQLGLTKK